MFKSGSLMFQTVEAIKSISSRDVTRERVLVRPWNSSHFGKRIQFKLKHNILNKQLSHFIIRFGKAPSRPPWEHPILNHEEEEYRTQISSCWPIVSDFPMRTEPLKKYVLSLTSRPGLWILNVACSPHSRILCGGWIWSTKEKRSILRLFDF